MRRRIRARILGVAVAKRERRRAILARTLCPASMRSRSSSYRRGRRSKRVRVDVCLDDCFASPEPELADVLESPEAELVPPPPPPPPLVAVPTRPVAPESPEIAFVPPLVAPLTRPVAASVASDVPLVWLVTTVVWPVRSEATVVCDAMVERAPVTVPTGSMPPAVAALLKPPQSASITRKVIRNAAAVPSRDFSAACRGFSNSNRFESANLTAPSCRHARRTLSPVAAPANGPARIRTWVPRIMSPLL